MQRQIEQVRLFLKAHYPLAFGQSVPLAIGIHKEIFAAAPELPRTAVRTYLWRRCTGKQYQTALPLYSRRRHLTGEDAGINASAGPTGENRPVTPPGDVAGGLESRADGTHRTSVKAQGTESGDGPLQPIGPTI